MIVKKFQADTETEAILKAKEELGSGAVVLNVKTLKQRGIFRLFKKDAVEVTAALEEKEFTATAGGGAVEVTISGKREVTKVKLQEEVVDPDDVEMLEDLIVAATNEALRKCEEESQAQMAKITGGLGGLGGGLF